MKAESLTIIRNIIAGSENRGGIYQDIDLARAQELLRGLIRIETPSTTNKFDLWKWVAKDDMRPVMTGIYHEGGFKVASDGHVLCKVQETYLNEDEGCILTKDGVLHCTTNEAKDRGIGNFIGKYPKFNDVIPADDLMFAVKVDLDGIKEFAKTVKAETSAYKGTGMEIVSLVKVSYDARTVEHIMWTGKKDEEVSATYFRLEPFLKLASFMEAYGIDTIMFSKKRPNMTAAKVTDGTNTAIIMPCMAPEEHEDNEFKKILTFEA